MIKIPLNSRIPIKIHTSTKIEWFVASASETSHHSNKFIRICRQFLTELSPKHAEFPLSHYGRKFAQKFLDPNPDPDDFQNLTVTSLSRDNFLVKYFMKIRLLVFM